MLLVKIWDMILGLVVFVWVSVFFVYEKDNQCNEMTLYSCELIKGEFVAGARCGDEDVCPTVYSCCFGTSCVLMKGLVLSKVVLGWTSLVKLVFV